MKDPTPREYGRTRESSYNVIWRWLKNGIAVKHGINHLEKWNCSPKNGKQITLCEPWIGTSSVSLQHIDTILPVSSNTRDNRDIATRHENMSKRWTSNPFCGGFNRRGPCTVILHRPYRSVQRMAQTYREFQNVYIQGDEAALGPRLGIIVRYDRLFAIMSR